MGQGDMREGMGAREGRTGGLHALPGGARGGTAGAAPSRRQRGAEGRKMTKKERMSIVTRHTLGW
eukprot:3521199-Pyramimonas_sp.AAC.1